MARLFLCAGLQSSGSTLISWCFLQRPDFDGILDARFDMVPTLPPVKQNAWCKFTIASFRFEEIMAHFRDDGWEITPLLVVRDLRSVFNSLITKSYGRNGTTADDPPLRIRLRRFLDDWKLFQKNNWPILKFESLIANGQSVLETACAQMNLPWDECMTHWKKNIHQIAAAGYGNETFIRNRKISLADSIDPSQLKIKTENIPPADLQWIESHFAEFNQTMDYPQHVPSQYQSNMNRAIPDFQSTRRYQRIARKHTIVRFFRKLTGRPLLTAAEISLAIGIPVKVTE